VRALLKRFLPSLKDGFHFWDYTVISMGCAWTAGELWAHNDNIPSGIPISKESYELIHSHHGGASFQSAEYIFLFCVFWKLCSTQTNYFIFMNEMNICQ